MDCGYRRLGRVPVCGKAPSNFGRAKEVAPNHAVYVQHLFDWAALTPLAMEKLKLGPGAPLPANGEVQLDPTGKPTGIITGNTGTFLTLVSKVPKPTFETQVEGIRKYLAALTR